MRYLLVHLEPVWKFQSGAFQCSILVSGQARDLPEPASCPQHEAQSRLAVSRDSSECGEIFWSLAGFTSPWSMTCICIFNMAGAYPTRNATNPLTHKPRARPMEKIVVASSLLPMRYIGYRLLRCSLKPNLGLFQSVSFRVSPMLELPSGQRQQVPSSELSGRTRS
jgi:hypothetical protein